ncbi:hypothetical protein ACLOJK_001792 [Asimina triloba]
MVAYVNFSGSGEESPDWKTGVAQPRTYRTNLMSAFISLTALGATLINSMPIEHVERTLAWKAWVLSVMDARLRFFAIVAILLVAVFSANLFLHHSPAALSSPILGYVSPPTKSSN